MRILLFVVAFTSFTAASRSNDRSVPLATGTDVNPTTSLWSSDYATSSITYTTTTKCPVTETKSTGSSHSIYTTLTTSTITVTSFVYSQPTSTDFTPYPTANSTAFPDSSGPTVIPSASSSLGTGVWTSVQTFPTGILGTGIPSLSIPTATTTITESTTMTFVPQSSLVGIVGNSRYYSTYLSISYSTFSTISTMTSDETVLPTTTTTTESSDIAGATSSLPENCLPGQTIYSTIYVTVAPGAASSSTEAIAASITNLPPSGSEDSGNEFLPGAGTTTTYVPNGLGTPTGGFPSGSGTPNAYLSGSTGLGTGIYTGFSGLPTSSANGTYSGNAFARRWFSPLF